MVGYEMCASLILSILQQLVADQAPIVRKAAAHNLAILLPRFTNIDKYSKVSPAKGTTYGSCILTSTVPGAQSKHFSFGPVAVSVETVVSEGLPKSSVVTAKNRRHSGLHWSWTSTVCG